MTLLFSSPQINDRAASLCVLLLDGDALFRDRVLVPKLQQFGFDVMTAGRVTEMCEAISRRLPDIVMLDVGLPDGSGFDVARKLHEEHAGVGVVILTARSENADVVRGLNEGADAYLAKPVEMDVLIATLYSVARRLESSARTARAVWRLSADAWFLLSPAGGKVRLSKAERRLLRTVMKWPNVTFSRDSLIAALTDDVAGFDPHRLDAVVYRLRRKVLTKLGEPLPLDVVHGTGFLLAI